MPRPSPQTERLVEVLEFLAADTSQQRSLAEIARMLQVDKATCHPMLIELTRRGWLVRHPHRKTYQLGPRLVSIGDAARGATNVVDIARPSLAGLADELGVACAALVTSSADLVVAEIVQPRGTRRGTVGQQIGDRIQFRPPLAGIFMAWRDEPAIRGWLDQDVMGKPETGVESHYRTVLAAVRGRGYGVECALPGEEALGVHVQNELEDVRGGARERVLESVYSRMMRPQMAIAELDPGRQYLPFSINAPVFDDSAVAVLAVCAYDFRTPLSAAEVHTIGLTVRATAHGITRAIYGIDPPLHD
ncbi:MAG: IclR family transcriptional regulator [Cumulibacter sp.]